MDQTSHLPIHLVTTWTISIIQQFLTDTNQNHFCFSYVCLRCVKSEIISAANFIFAEIVQFYTLYCSRSFIIGQYYFLQIVYKTCGNFVCTGRLANGLLLILWKQPYPSDRGKLSAKTRL